MSNTAMRTKSAIMLKELINDHAEGAIDTYRFYDQLLRIIELQYVEGKNAGMSYVIEKWHEVGQTDLVK